MIPHVYIEYHPNDYVLVETLICMLNKNGIQTTKSFYHELDDYREYTENILKDNDLILWILSKNTLKNDFLFWYLSVISEFEFLEENRKLMLPVFVDVDIPIFDFLSGRVRYLIVGESPVEQYNDIVHTIQINAGQRFFNEAFRKNCKQEAIRQLHKAYVDKNLILFCGAGISAGSGIPTWNDLLIRCFLKSSNLPSSYTNVLYDMLSKDLYLNQAILARMIKNSNEKDFYKLVQQTLYENKEKDETETIKAIVELCESSKDGGVKSIVTYNFDDLLECNLRNRNIKYQNRPADAPIKKDSLPIYHVHGFLPRDFNDNDICNIVFSEDEYHEQYSNPHDNATLTQQTALETGTCLYIGISFTDPNMRRLADVYIKRHQNCKKNPRHYLIKQKPRTNLNWEYCFLSQKKVLEQIMFLEERDAESFGLRIIWIDEFNEIAQLFKDIRNENIR